MNHFISHQGEYNSTILKCIDQIIYTILKRPIKIILTKTLINGIYIHDSNDHLKIPFQLRFYRTTTSIIAKYTFTTSTKYLQNYLGFDHNKNNFSPLTIVNCGSHK